MESVRQDVRLATRMLSRQPGFSTIAVATLALGLGLTTVLFTVLDAVFLRPLPFANPEQLVHTKIATSAPGRQPSLTDPSVDDLRDWQAHGGVFTHVAAYRNATNEPLILDGDEPQRITATRISRDYFRMYGVSPSLGRDFSDAEYAAGSADVAILSHALWTSRFGASSAVVGQTIHLNGKPTTVVGVMPPQFFPKTKLWRPFDIVHDLPRRGSGASVDARLRPNLSIREAEATLTALAGRVAADRGGPAVSVQLPSMYEAATKGNATTARVISYAVALLLLLACVNVAGLMLARGTVRRSEMALRTSLGASRMRLVRQLLSESLVLSAVAGAIGVGLAWLSLDVLVANIPMALPENAPVEIDLRAVAFALIAVILTSMLFGLVPALRASRVNPGEALAGASQRHTSSWSRRGGKALIAIEVAIALVLLTGAGVMLRSFSKVTSVDLGFDPSPLIGMRISPSDPSAAAQAHFYPALLERVSAHSGVAAAGATTSAPLLGGLFSFGVVRVPNAGPVEILIHRFMGDYFNTLGVPLLEGRVPTPADAGREIPLVVITKRTARKLFGDQPALGQQIQMTTGRAARSFEVAAVVGDVRQDGWRSLSSDVVMWQLFEPSDTRRNELAFIVRPTDAGGITPGELRQIGLGFGRSLVVRDVTRGSDWLDDNVVTYRRRTVLLGLLGSFGLILALVGVFGATAYAVSRRTREIGVRVAIGASPSCVVRTMLGDAALPVLIGIAGGLIASWWTIGAIKTFLFKTEPRDLATFGWMTVILMGAALIAAWIPARRAARVDPIMALRSE